MFKAAKPGCLFTTNTAMYTRFPNSIAALIVTGNCKAEVFHSANHTFSCAKRGSSSLQRTSLRSLSLYARFSPSKRWRQRASSAPTRQRPPSLPSLLSGNIGMATGMQPLQVDHSVLSFCFTPPMQQQQSTPQWSFSPDPHSDIPSNKLLHQKHNTYWIVAVF